MFGSIAVPLLAGLAVFLFGMKGMELSLHRLGGKHLTGALQTFTGTPARGLAASAVLTALLQSSTAVTVVTIGLVNSGLMTFPQTLGIILGTNIGTCLTTELLGLELHRYAKPLLAAAVAVWSVFALTNWSRLPAARTVCLAAAAVAFFACILLGIGWMQEVGPHLRNLGMFTWFEQQAQTSYMWGVAAGTVLSAVLHSSAATIAMAMAMASTGGIGLELGIAIVLGANIGTCATALLASIGGSRYGVYVAWAHALLNIGGALVFYPLLHPFAQITELMSATPAAQIARAQTIYNVASSLIALPFCYLPFWNRFNRLPG